MPAIQKSLGNWLALTAEKLNIPGLWTHKEPESYAVELYGLKFIVWFFPCPGSRITEHAHTFEHGTILLFGELSITGDAEDRQKITAPDVARFPAGNSHSLKCLSPMALSIHVYKPGDEIMDGE